MNEPEPALFEPLEPGELKARLDAGEKLTLIDVREPFEWELARIEGAKLMPLSQGNAWIPRIDPQGGPYALICHHGVRSAQVCAYLARMGVKGCLNVSGGIDAWSRDVDPSVPRY